MARTETSDEPLEGHRLMMARLRPLGAHSQQWLADFLEIGQPSVSSWVRKVSRPEPPYRLALWFLWKIPPRTWLTADEIKKVQRLKERAATLGEGTQVDPTDDDAEPSERPKARAPRVRAPKVTAIKPRVRAARAA